MKMLGLITAAFILLFGTVASHGANVDRISTQTGVPVATLQAERASTGLGWGELENAHLLANALAANGSNLTFNDLVAMHQAGEGWGKIAHDNGLNLGRIVSDAHRSSRAAVHAQNTQTVHGKSGKSATTAHGKSTAVHGKSATNIGRGHSNRMTTTRSVSRGSSFRTANMGFHGMGHSMGGMGHGGRGR
jgi:hypothetical protein